MSAENAQQNECLYVLRCCSGETSTIVESFLQVTQLISGEYFFIVESVISLDFVNMHSIRTILLCWVTAVAAAPVGDGSSSLVSKWRRPIGHGYPYIWQRIKGWTELDCYKSVAPSPSA